MKIVHFIGGDLPEYCGVIAAEVKRWDHDGVRAMLLCGGFMYWNHHNKISYRTVEVTDEEYEILKERDIARQRVVLDNYLGK